MKQKILILNGKTVNEGEIKEQDVLIEKGRIESIGANLSGHHADVVIDASGRYVLPGLIDDQVHFREPGLTHKGNIGTESRAAVAGGITSFMEMPNTKPPTVNQVALHHKFEIAQKVSPANFSFYLGATNDNIEEVKKLDPTTICGVKVFMGSSTGNMLVDNQKALEQIFANSPTLVATHCEDEFTIRRNMEFYKNKMGDDISFDFHPEIRSEEACYLSSSKAVDLAHKFGTRLHVLHISTARELALFKETGPVGRKKITCEACVHHLWFDKKDYETKGALIKWNPAVKSAVDKAAIQSAVASDIIDVLATDHAPHTLDEKNKNYFNAPSGGPLVQHALLALFELTQQGKFSLEKLVEKYCHAPADAYRIIERGYLREGYWADVTILDPEQNHEVTQSNILYHCGWSPFMGHKFPASVTHTIVSGQLAYQNGVVNQDAKGQRLAFLPPWW